MNVNEFTLVQRVLLAASYVTDKVYSSRAEQIVGAGGTIVPKLLNDNSVLTGPEVVALYQDTQEDLCLGDIREACNGDFGSHHKEGDHLVLTHPEMYSPAIGAALTLLVNHPTMVAEREAE